MKNGLVTFKNGDRYWYRNDVLHREDGPAIEYADGNRYWVRDGKYHRTDGPAIERANGVNEWWENGVKIKGAEGGKV